MKRDKGSSWNQMYGSIRRAKDRKLLQELERQIEAEEIVFRSGSQVDSAIDRVTIARAFGRPLN